MTIPAKDEARALELLRHTAARHWSPAQRECAIRLMLSYASEREREAIERAAGWRDISTAPKDRTRILVQLRDPLPVEGRPDLERWHGIPFVASHNGVEADGFDIGWQFAAPVGQGGFPDSWMAGWMPLPDATAIRRLSQEGGE